MDNTNLYNTIYKINCSTIEDLDYLQFPSKTLTLSQKKNIQKIYQFHGLEG